MKVGVLTGGGDCPGLNAVIRGLVRRGIEDHGYEFIGIKNGWLGLIENTYVPLDIPAISGILHRGGTILGTSRTNPLKSEDKLKKLLENVKKNKFNVILSKVWNCSHGTANQPTMAAFLYSPPRVPYIILD